VRRILTLKFELGLFDHPFVDPDKADAAVTANRELARQAADESITLLRNQGGLLPLSTSARLVVTGPSADSVANQLGGWSVSWQGVFGSGHVCCMGPADQIPDATTVLKGIQNAGAGVVSVPTDQVVTAGQQAAAVAATQAADVNAAVVVVGERAYSEGLGDNSTPALPADQQGLIGALQGTGKPVIVVVIAGRPLGLGPGASTAGLLMAYLPGTEGGSAVADVLFGRVNPSGKLPVTWPSAADRMAGDFDTGGPSTPGDEPKFFDQLPGTNSGPGSNYNPRFGFGFGLSYTTFQVSALSVTGSVPARGGSVTATFTVTNTGSRAGTDIVPVYVRQPVSEVIAPQRRLMGFTRVTLDPGQAKTVQVTFPVSQLAVTQGDIDAAGRRAVEPGGYQAMVDALTAPFTVSR